VGATIPNATPVTGVLATEPTGPNGEGGGVKISTAGALPRHRIAVVAAASAARATLPAALVGLRVRRPADHTVDGVRHAVEVQVVLTLNRSVDVDASASVNALFEPEGTAGGANNSTNPSTTQPPSALAALAGCNFFIMSRFFYSSSEEARNGSLGVPPGNASITDDPALDAFLLAPDVEGMVPPIEADDAISQLIRNVVAILSAGSSTGEASLRGGPPFSDQRGAFGGANPNASISAVLAATQPHAGIFEMPPSLRTNLTDFLWGATPARRNDTNLIAYVGSMPSPGCGSAFWVLDTVASPMPAAVVRSLPPSDVAWAMSACKHNDNTSTSDDVMEGPDAAEVSEVFSVAVYTPAAGSADALPIVDDVVVTSRVRGEALAWSAMRSALVLTRDEVVLRFQRRATAAAADGVVGLPRPRLRDAVSAWTSTPRVERPRRSTLALAVTIPLVAVAGALVCCVLAVAVSVGMYRAPVRQLWFYPAARVAVPVAIRRPGEAPRVRFGRPIRAADPRDDAAATLLYDDDDAIPATRATATIPGFSHVIARAVAPYPASFLRRHYAAPGHRGRGVGVDGGDASFDRGEAGAGDALYSDDDLIGSGGDEELPDEEDEDEEGEVEEEDEEDTDM
jgi:hypothetical protein